MIEGAVLDTSVVIAAERRRQPIEEVLGDLRAIVGDVTCVLSSITVVEFTHGIARARTANDRIRRQRYYSELLKATVVLPITLEIAQLAGKIEGEQAAIGNTIDLADLLIGATASHLGYAVATLNVRHFERIPGLQVVTF